MKNKGVLTRITLLMALLSLALVGCVAQLGTGWAGLTVLEDGQHIAYAYENTLAIVDVTGGQPIPLTQNGDIRVTDNGQVIRWEIDGNDYDNAKFFAPPLMRSDNTLLALTLDRRLLAIDRQNATVSVITEEPIGQRGNAVTRPIRAGDKILIGLQERLLALDANTLAPTWEIETNYAVWSPPLVMDDIAYFTSLDHSMYAVDLGNGEIQWSLDLGGAATATPAYYEADDAFFVGTFERKVLKISRSGQVITSYDTDEWVWGSPLLVDDMLYVVDLAGVVYKLDPATLTEVNGWKRQVAEAAIRTTPAVFDDYVVVGSRDERVYWLNRDNGGEIFNRRLDGEILSDVLYFPANDTNDLEESLIVVSTLSNRESLVAFGATNGERVWTYRR